LFIPLVLVLVFGFLSKGSGSGNIKVSLTDYANNQASHAYVDAVKKVDAFKLDQTDEATAREELGKGKIDLQVIIPNTFGGVKNGQPAPSTVQTYFNQGRPGNGQTASLILGQITSGFNSQITRSPAVYGLKSEGVKTNNLGYIDFILPGIMAMSIMQLGIFTVAFAFISYKTTGALRRIQATPIKPSYFLIAQSITRYIIGLLQIALLVAIGVAFFDLHLLGNILTLLVVVTLGIVVFLAMGFGIAGGAKDENQAAPFANLIQFPQLFLSGVFFPRDDFPHWLKVVTDFLPLTFLSDAMRRIFNEGASLWAVHTDILGLIVWGIIAYLIADRVFRWE
jgi:ABC-2 type transport system permease protein